MTSEMKDLNASSKEELLSYIAELELKYADLVEAYLKCCERESELYIDTACLEMERDELASNLKSLSPYEIHSGCWDKLWEDVFASDERNIKLNRNNSSPILCFSYTKNGYNNRD